MLAGGRRATRRLTGLARIFPSDDVPVARGLMMCGKSKQGVKRDMPMEAPIVAEHEFIEIAVDVLAAQAVICAEAPSLHQRESDESTARQCGPPSCRRCV